MTSQRPGFDVAAGGTLRGELRVPGDKSVSHRALMFGGMAEGTTDITGFLDGEDCLATLKALQSLGVRIERPGAQQVRVYGTGGRFTTPQAPLDMGNAGTAMRLFMGLLCGQPFDATLFGDASLSRRPMERVAAPLRLMGARIDTHDGLPPVRLHGGSSLHAIDFPLPVASAQLKSALLLAGLHAKGTTRVTEPAVTRDHTERMLRAFGVEVRQQDRSVSIVGGQRLRAAPVDVPGDFSSAAFFLVAGCLAAADEGLVLRNVGLNPTRTGLLQMLQAMGARIDILSRGAGAEPVADLRVHRSALRGIRVAPEWVSLAIDEFPVFFIAAASAEGVTEVSGAEELRVKESDRLAVMADGLKVLGVRHELRPDGIRIEGGPYGGGQIDSHGDHRIAMAFAVAALRATAPIEIADVANVATSFPGFAALARAAGLGIELREGIPA